MLSTEMAQVNRESFRDSLRGGDRNRFPIVLGTGLDSGQDFLHALGRRGYHLSERIVGYLMGGAFKVKVKKMATITLVIVTPRELGYTKPFDFGEGEVYDRARQLGVGLGLCPPETAFQILIQAYGRVTRFPEEGFELSAKLLWPNDESRLSGALLIWRKKDQMGVRVVNAHSARLVFPDNRFTFVLK